jgi:hypothetical protein
MTATTKHLIKSAVLVAALATTGATISAGPASAGPNGQQVQVCTSKRLPQSALLMGTNQNGKYTVSRRTWLSEGARKCASFDGYWKGNITVRWYHGDGQSFDQQSYIPPSQDLPWSIIYNN